MASDSADEEGEVMLHTTCLISKWEMAAIFLHFFVIGFGVSEIWTVLGGNAQSYPWGWEGGGFAYRSPRNYLIVVTSITVYFCAFLIMALASQDKFTRKTALAFSFSAAQTDSFISDLA